MWLVCSVLSGRAVRAADPPRSTTHNPPGVTPECARRSHDECDSRAGVIKGRHGPGNAGPWSVAKTTRCWCPARSRRAHQAAAPLRCQQRRSRRKSAKSRRISSVFGQQSGSFTSLTSAGVYRSRGYGRCASKKPWSARTVQRRRRDSAASRRLAQRRTRGRIRHVVLMEPQTRRQRCFVLHAEKRRVPTCVGHDLRQRADPGPILPALVHQTKQAMAVRVATGVHRPERRRAQRRGGVGTSKENPVGGHRIKPGLRIPGWPYAPRNRPRSWHCTISTLSRRCFGKVGLLRRLHTVCDHCDRHRRPCPDTILSERVRRPNGACRRAKIKPSRRLPVGIATRTGSPGGTGRSTAD